MAVLVPSITQFTTSTNKDLQGHRSFNSMSVALSRLKTVHDILVHTIHGGTARLRIKGRNIFLVRGLSGEPIQVPVRHEYWRDDIPRTRKAFRPSLQRESWISSWNFMLCIAVYLISTCLHKNQV
jgi:hypothetical protein